RNQEPRPHPLRLLRTLLQGRPGSRVPRGPRALHRDRRARQARRHLERGALTMQPTLAASEVRRNITQYLSTTFALADEPVREGLESFFNDPAQGIFRGPYLRVRTPFRTSDDSWRSALEWHPADFTPFLHQAKAFQRLSSL